MLLILAEKEWLNEQAKRKKWNIFCWLYENQTLLTKALRLIKLVSHLPCWSAVFCPVVTKESPRTFVKEVGIKKNPKSVINKSFHYYHKQSRILWTKSSSETDEQLGLLSPFDLIKIGFTGDASLFFIDMTTNESFRDEMMFSADIENVTGEEGGDLQKSGVSRLIRRRTWCLPV